VLLLTQQNTTWLWQKIANQLNIKFTLEDNELLKGVSQYVSRHYIRIRQTTASQEDKNEWLKQKMKSTNYLVDMDQSELLPDVDHFTIS
jgi:beta-phosphoglucomutase